MTTQRILGMALILVVWSVSSHAEQRLTIGLINLPPLAYRDAEQHVTGVLSDIADQIIQRTGLTLQKELLPWARVANALSSGELDIAFGLNVNLPPAIEAIARAYDVRCLILHRNDIAIQTYDDLYRLTGEVGMMRGVFFFQRLRDDPAIKKYEVTNYEQGIRMLGMNRLDAMAITDIGAFALIQKYHFGDVITFPGYLYETTEVSLLISKHSPYYQSAVHARLQSVVDALREEGIIQRITDQYIGQGWNE